MDRYEEIKELANTIQEIRKDYTDRNKSWMHQYRPNLKGGLNTYLAIKLYDKGYRKETIKNKQFKKKVDVAYSPSHDITFILEECYMNEKIVSTEIVGFYYGEPDEKNTIAYYGKIKAQY